MAGKIWWVVYAVVPNEQIEYIWHSNGRFGLTVNVQDAFRHAAWLGACGMAEEFQRHDSYHIYGVMPVTT